MLDKAPKPLNEAPPVTSVPKMCIRDSPKLFELLHTPVVPAGAVQLKAVVAPMQMLFVPEIAFVVMAATVTAKVDVDTQPLVAVKL